MLFKFLNFFYIEKKNYQWNNKKKLYYICLSSLYKYNIINIDTKIAYIYSKNDYY